MDHEGVSVLLVEDEARLRDVLVRSVRSMELACDGVASGEEALREMSRRHRDIAIVDLNLPGMSGMDLFAELRRRHPATQVIVLTAFGDLDAARRVIHMDVVDFMTKPCHLGDLESAIDRARRRLQDPRSAPDHLLDAPEAMDDAATGVEGVEAAAPVPGMTLDELERAAILGALRRHQGHRRRAAAELGISLRKLYYCLHRYQALGLLDELDGAGDGE